MGKYFFILIISVGWQVNLISQNNKFDSVIDIYWEDSNLKDADSIVTKNYSWSTKTIYLNGRVVEQISFGSTHEKVYYTRKYKYKDSLIIEQRKRFPNREYDDVLTTFTYDTSGILLKQTRLEGSELNYEYTYNYNNNDQLIKQTNYYYLGDRLYEFNLKYNEFGKLIQEIFESADSKKITLFDRNGNSTDEKYYDPIDSLKHHSISEYDSEGNLTKNEFWRGGRLFKKSELFYDKENGIEKRIISQPKDETQRIQIIKIKENENGDWIEKRVFENNVLKSIHKRIIKYTV